MRTNGLSVLALGGALLLAAGCNKTPASVNTAPFKSALNTYYQSHPSCAFEQPVKFPLDIAPGGNQPDPAEIQRLDALADAGLLSKKTKKVWVNAQGANHVRVHEDESVFDLTDQGKAAWTSQDGGGNFCYATPKVTSIDHYSPEPNNTRYGVSYNYRLGSLPSWASNDKVKAAFPTLAAAETSGRSLTGLATLTKTDNGWKASGVASITSVPVPQGNSSSGDDNGGAKSGS